MSALEQVKSAIEEAIHVINVLKPPENGMGTIVRLQDALASLQSPAVQEPKLPFAILPEEMMALERFHECALDGEGYDVPKEMMNRLSEIGLVRRIVGGYFEHTNFGLSVLNGDFASPLPQAAPSTAVPEEVQTGWLVENGKQGDELRYRTFEQGMPAWTSDHAKAIRYARREDAEMAHAEDEDAWRIAEHMWHGVAAPAHPVLAAAQKAQSDAMDAVDIVSVAKEALRELSHIENHLERAEAPTTVRNRTIDLRSYINDLVAALKSTPAPADSRDAERPIVREIGEERKRQMSVEGWTEEHDDEHSDRSLAQAARCYVEHYVGRSWLPECEPDGARRYQAEEMPREWPDSWDENWWKPKNPRRDLIRAAALIVAEIERIDRAAIAQKDALSNTDATQGDGRDY